MTATELTESTERGVWGGKSISVFSVAESYKKQIKFSIVQVFNPRCEFQICSGCDLYRNIPLLLLWPAV